jgi:hypothetical protein
LTLNDIDTNPWLNNFTPHEYDKYMAEFKKKKAELDKVIIKGK